jgi:soluble lytic murein transglycosylase
MTAPGQLAAAVLTELAPEDPVNMVAAALTACPNPLPRDQRFRVARVILEESTQHGYDPLFITALVQVESGCRPSVRGGGAIGLTQLLPSTARGVAPRAGVRWRGPATLTDPEDNVRIGVRYLSELEDMLDCPYRAVAAYNMGPAPVLRMSTSRARRVGYVRKVLNRYEHLREEFA